MKKTKCEILPKTDPNWIFLFYCKCRKLNGNPIIIKYNGKEYYARKVRFRNMGDYDLEFNNSPKEIARRGATTVLQYPASEYKLRCIRTDDIYQIKGIKKSKIYRIDK